MPRAKGTLAGTTAVSTDRLPTLRTLPSASASRRQSTTTKHSAAQKHAAYFQQLQSRATHLRAEAKQYRDAGNLEQTLATYLDLCLTLEHLRDAPGTCNTKALKSTTAAELRSVYMILDQLHRQVQGKKSYYHECMDSDSDDEDNLVTGEAAGEATGARSTSSASAKRLPCGHVRPVRETNDVTLSSIVGNHSIKQDILNGIVEPFRQPLLFRVRRSFLFYGPPGTGKTMFAKAAAHSLGHMTPHLQVLYFAPTTDMLKDKYVGGSEKKITAYFRCVQQQAEDRQVTTGTPTMGVIFLDEVDSLARSREHDDGSGTSANTTNALLQMMDGFSALPNVIVMAATNYPWQLDAAILSRFQEKIYVRLPDVGTIQALLRHNLLRFYKQTLGITANTDPLAEEHTGTDPDGARWDILSRVLQVSDDKLLLVARRLCQPVPYSPSNIQDVCLRAFRACARSAHESGIFHEVRVATSGPAFRKCTKAEKSLLHHLNHKYADATTFARLKQAYGKVLADTEPYDIHQHQHEHQQQTDSAVTSARRSVSQSFPERVRVGDVTYTRVQLLDRSSLDAATQAFVQLFEHHPHVGVYILSDRRGSDGLQFAVVREYCTQFGPYDNHVLQVCAVGVMKAETLHAIDQYGKCGLSNIQSRIERLLGITPLRWVHDGLHAVYCRDMAAVRGGSVEGSVGGSAGGDTDDQPADGAGDGWWHVRYPHAMAPTPTHLFHAQHTSAADPLLLHTFPWATSKALFRFVCWLAGCDTKKALSKQTGDVQLANAVAEHSVQFVHDAHTTPTPTAAHRKAIEQQLFTLNVSLDAMMDAVDGEANEDAVVPSVSAKEIERLDAY